MNTQEEETEDTSPFLSLFPFFFLSFAHSTRIDRLKEGEKKQARKGRKREREGLSPAQKERRKEERSWIEISPVKNDRSKEAKKNGALSLSHTHMFAACLCGPKTD